MGEIKMDVQRMVKRRKDSGFTLIELMIVIAVIGILAIVLVPKIGAVKTTAKTSGIDVNIRTAQAEVQGHIDNWSTTFSQSTIVTVINNDVSDTVNPFNSAQKGVIAVTSLPTPIVNGTVYVIVPATVTDMNDATKGINITGYDNSGNVYSTVRLNP